MENKSKQRPIGERFCIGGMIIKPPKKDNDNKNEKEIKRIVK